MSFPFFIETVIILFINIEKSLFIFIYSDYNTKTVEKGALMDEQIIFYTQAYNAEQYLEKAIISILNQTYTNFLYYVVDDGSSDNTRNIIQKYATIDSRIIPIYHNSNSYLNCYNETLKQIYTHKEANYFAFLDADDWYEPTFAEKGIQSLKDSNSDLYICGSIFESPTGEIIGSRQWTLDKREFSSREVPDYFTHLHSFFRTCWAKIYRLPHLRDHQVTVPTTLPVGFDTGFFFQVLTYTKNFTISSELLHHYLVDLTSTSYRYIPNRIQCDIELSHTTLSYLETINGNTAKNLFFCALVNLNAFKDTFKVSLQAYHDNKIPLEELKQLLASDFLHEIKERLHQLSPLVQGSRQQLQNFRTEIVAYLLSEYKEKDNEIFFAILTKFIPSLSLFYEPKDMEKFFSKKFTNRERLDYLLHSEKSALQIFLQYPIKDYSSFDITLIGLLQLYCNNDFSTIIKRIENYQTFSQKQIRYIISKQPILSKVNDSDRLFYYPSLLLSLLKEDYKTITQELPNQIHSLSSTDPKTALVFAQIGSYTSALLSMEEYYIFFLKAELEFLYQLQRFTEVNEKLEELLPFLPDDEELLQLQEKLKK